MSETKTCLNCGADLDSSALNDRFCTELCELRHLTTMLKDENLGLQNKVNLLNSLRTACSLEPDLSQTTEQNVLNVRLNLHKWLFEQTPDYIFAYHKMVFEASVQSYKIVQKQNIKQGNDQKVKKDLAAAQEKRAETTLPANPEARERELFIRAKNKEGFSNAEGEKLWKKERDRVKAILGMMKIPGMTREKAEQLVGLA